MLFKETHLNGIKLGKITFAFRKWQKASVKSGTLLHTAIGLIAIGKIEIVNENEITDTDALLAGFNKKEQLLKTFTRNSTGIIFKIAVAYHSADPRIALREQTALSEQQFTDLKRKLKRLDEQSKHDHWTRKVLWIIKENPNLPATGIAKLTGYEKEWLKLNIRKLKNLGLTMSLLVGYELSPLGEQIIKITNHHSTLNS